MQIHINHKYTVDDEYRKALAFFSGDTTLVKAGSRLVRIKLLDAVYSEMKELVDAYRMALANKTKPKGAQ